MDALVAKCGGKMRDKKKVRVDASELTPVPFRVAPAVCFVTYSCHLIILQTAGTKADVTRLYPSGYALFSLLLITQGHRSTTPKWCVGVCSGPVRVWVTSLVHPHCHDTAQNNRLARLPAEAGSSDSVAHPVCVPTVYFVPMWAGESAWGESHPHSGLVCTVMSAMQHSGVQESVLFMLFVSLPPQAVCLFVRWADYWCCREQRDNFLII